MMLANRPACAKVATSSIFRVLNPAQLAFRQPARRQMTVAAAPQGQDKSSAVTTETLSVVDIIKQEHSRVNSLYDEYKSASPGTSKHELAWLMIRELSIHAAKEEMVLYPEIRKKLGDAEADQSLAEHQELKEKLSDLDAMDPSTPEFDSQLQNAVKSFVKHSKEEESKFLPAFSRADGVDARYLGDLGQSYKLAEAVAPSRPHPLAPNAPPLNGPANALTTPLDKVRDAARFGTPNPDPEN